jgi:hypothetical protein
VAALTPALARCDGAVYIAMSSSELDVLQSAFRAAGGHWSTFIIWAKNTFTMGRADYQRQYEPILYGWPEGQQTPLVRRPRPGRRLADQEAAEERSASQICSPAKAILENGTAIDCEWNTTSCGNETLVPSQTGIASITSTTISKIITFQTCNLSPTLSTSGFTPVASCAMAFGGSTVVAAGHLNPYPYAQLI